MKLKIFIFLSILIMATIAGGCKRTFTPPLGEVEAKEFNGVVLTPIAEQGNNGLRGTQRINRETYRLVVDGLVERPLSISYDDLLKYPLESKMIPLNCVEGWNFNAKWTGPRISAIFDDAKVKPEVNIVIFHCADQTGYSSLSLQYIREKNIILGLKLNDVTLPEERGFPFQVVAENKFGYKWAKWVTRIELSDNADFRGYWEADGYNNNADIKGPEFEENTPLFR